MSSMNVSTSLSGKPAVSHERHLSYCRTARSSDLADGPETAFPGLPLVHCEDILATFDLLLHHYASGTARQNPRTHPTHKLHDR